MYRGETFNTAQYFLSATPLLLVFTETMYVGTRILNEEYLMGFRPLHRKITEAIYNTIDRAHVNISLFLVNMSIVPVVFMVELAAVALVTNLPIPFMVGGMMITGVIIEEVAKSLSVVVLAQNRALKGVKQALVLGVISAAGFMLMEKLLTFVLLKVVDDSMFIQALSDGGMLLLPLVLHAVSTSVVCMIVAKFGTRYYPLALLAGIIIHLAYNVAVLGSVL